MVTYIKKIRVISIIALLLLLCGSFFYLGLAKKVNAEWFNDAWGYRQGIRFTNSGAAVDDQKVLVQFATNTPISANKMQSSCQDVRFTDAQGKLLQYYINTSGGAGIGCNDASSDFYVLMPSIVASVNLIYIYYGNPASSAGTAAANFDNATFSPSAGPTAASEEVSPGAIAYWKFDENSGATANDATGHGNSLTLASTAWATQSASLSNRTTYLQFNGSTSVASRANDTDFDFGTGSFSVSTWFRHASSASFTDVLITKYNTAGWKVYMNASGFICFGIDDDSTWGPDDSACSTVSFADSKWHHVEVVKSTTTSITVYVDGNQVAQTLALTATGTLSTTATLYVGADSSGTTNWWDGAVDDLAIYPYARSAAQVATDAGGTHTATVMGAQTKDPLADGLTGYWKMDESSGNSVDSSGNGETLTNNGASFYSAGKFANGAGVFNGTSQYFSTTKTFTGIQTVSFWAYPASSSDNFINLASGKYISASSGVLAATGFTNPKIFVNGLQTTTITSNAWQLITVTDTEVISANVFEVGRANGSYISNGSFIDEVRLYNRALSSAEVRQLYYWAPGPVGWWKIDENAGTTASDSSGNGNAGTLTSGPVWSIGKVGQGITLDGSDDYVLVSDSNSLDVTTNFTISAWIYPITISGNRQIVSKDGGGDTTDAYNFFVQAGNRLCYETNNRAAVVCSPSSTITLGSWNHVAVVFDDLGTDKARFFVNGAQTGLRDASITQAPVALATNLLIGKRGNVGAEFNGKIDDVKIYNYSRTPTQVVEDMNGGHPPAGSPVGSSILNWKFDETYGSTANNSGYLGSLGNGAITGASWYSGGKIGNAIATTTSTNTISAGDQTFIDSATGLTAGFWVKPITLTTDKALISKSNMSTQNSFAVVTDATNSDEIRVHIPTSVSDVGTYFKTSSLDLANDAWSYVTVIYNASESASTRVRVYKDGKEISGSVTGTLPDKMTTGTTSLIKVGASDSGSYTALNAIFDEVKIYPYALTYDQMLIDFNGKNAMVLGSLSTHSDGATASSSASREFCVPGDTSACSPPVGWWKMDENTGTTAVDYSGSGFSGVITGATWTLGKRGAALNFSGGTDTVTVTGSLSTKSVSFWVYPQSTTQNILDLRTAATAANITVSSGVVAANGFTSPIIYVNGIQTTALIANVWQYVTVTTSTAITANAIRFGRVDSASLSGKLDGIAIYDYARTPAQISWDFNRGGPVGWWKMDESSWDGAAGEVKDSSGNGYNGVRSDSATTASGKYNNGGTFDGVNDNVIINAENSAIDIGSTSDNISVAAWIKTTMDCNTASGFCTIVAKDDGSGAYPYRLQINNSEQGRFQISDGTNNPTTTNTVGLADGNWHHLVGIRNITSDVVELYVDGNSITTSVDTTTADASNADSVSIGNGGGSYNVRDFSGLIDDVRIYNYALTSQQIKTVMGQGAVRFGP